MPHVTGCSTRRLTIAALALAILLASAAAPASAADDTPERRAGEVIPGSYIVTLAEGAGVAQVSRRHSLPAGAVTARYGAALHGFAANLSTAAAARLAADPAVASVEPDRWVSVAGTQSAPPWGLDRTDQRALPLSGSYTYGTTGAGVRVYVIDSGVRSTHADFDGRVASGFSAYGTSDDCNGHGTHVAGTAAGASYGVAKGATIVPVRVIDCDGWGKGKDIVAGIDWVTRQHTGGQPAVANISLVALGGADAVDSAVAAGIAAGITFVVAAGNAGEDACGYSPAKVTPALTVGASNAYDSRAWFSNHGPCLDLFAPGAAISSAWHTGDTAAKVLGGTSMAAPHVAGAAARYLQTDTAATPAQVATAIVGSATPLAVADAGPGSPTSLLHVAPPSSSLAWTTTAVPPSALTITTSASSLRYGQTLRIRGRLTSDGAGVPYAKIRVQARRLGTADWRLLGKAKTNKYGRVKFATQPSAGADYRLRYRRDTYAGSTSDKRRVGVRTRVRAALDSATVARGAKARLTGSVRPAHAGQEVILQRYRGDRWRSVRSKPLDAESNYRFALSTSKRGKLVYRVVKPADIDHLRGTSPRRTLTVE